jgi:hypothetical protein
MQDVKTPLEQSREPMRLGHCAATFVPHCISGIGARVFMVIDTKGAHEIINLSADDARRIADRLKIAACEAEAIGRKRQRTQELSIQQKG